MAVQEQTPYQEITANGVTTSFVLDFDCENKDHLIVTKDGVEPPVGEWSLINGAVVFTTAPLNGALIVIQRNTPFSRSTDYQSYNNSFRPGPVNKDFDWIWFKLQELGLADWILSKRLDKEIQDLVLADLALKADYTLRDSKLKEDYISRDAALKKYIDSMIALVTGASFDGIDASMVSDESGLTQQEINTASKSVNLISNLRLLKAKNGDVVKTNGHTEIGCGGGVYRFETMSSKHDNNGAWIASSVCAGTWVLISPLMFENFGMLNGSDDQSKKMQDCIDYARDNKIYNISFEKPNRYTINQTVIFKPYRQSERATYYSTSPKLNIQTNGASLTTTTNDITLFKVFREMVNIDVLNIVTTANNVNGVQVGIETLEDLYDTSEFVNSCAFFNIDHLYGTGLRAGVVFKPYGIFSNGYAYGAYYHSIGSVVFKDVKYGLIFDVAHDGKNQTTRMNIKSYKHNGGACSIVGLNLETFTIQDFQVENLKEMSETYPDASQRAVYIPEFGDGMSMRNHSITITGSCEEVPYPVYCFGHRCEINVLGVFYRNDEPSKAYSGNYTSASGGIGQIPYAVNPNKFIFAESRKRYAVINTNDAQAVDFPSIYVGQPFYGAIEFIPTVGALNESGVQLLYAEFPHPAIWTRTVSKINTNNPQFGPYIRIDKQNVASVRDIDLNTLRTTDGSKQTWSIVTTGPNLNSPNNGEWYGVLIWTPYTSSVDSEGMQEAINMLDGSRKWRKVSGNQWGAWV